MKTFRDFITETFLKGIKGNFEYTEIYKNPTAAELVEAGHKVGSDYGEPYYYLGAWITDKDVYVWNRENSEHNMVYRSLADELKGQKAYPCYLYWYAQARFLETEWAPSMNMGPSTDKAVLTMVKKHPRFAGIVKKFAMHWD